MLNFSSHLKNIPYRIHLRGQTSSLWKRAIVGKIFSSTCSDLRYVYIKIVHLGVYPAAGKFANVWFYGDVYHCV